jgi:ATP-binding cassette subfamily B protein
MTSFGAVARHGGGWAALIGLTSLAGSVGLLALPLVLGRCVDALVGGQPPGRWLILAAALIAVGVVADVVDSFATTACVARTTAWLRTGLIRRLLVTGPTRAGRFEVGDLVSRVSGNTVDAAQAGPSAVLIAAEVLPPVGCLVLLTVIDPWLAGSYLGGLLLIGLVLRAFTRHTGDVLLEYQQTQGRIAARLTESLAGARTIAAAGTLEQEQRRVLEPLAELRELGLRTWRVLARASGQAAAVGPLVLVLVLVVGGFRLAGGRITAGELFAAMQYVAIGAGLGGLTGVLGQLARARAGVARVREVLALPGVRHGDGELPDGPGRVELRGVTVLADPGPDGDRRPLLDGVDLVVPGGRSVAVVGPSGAGKSVLASVVARLRDPDRGLVLLDGVPLTTLGRRALRTAVGCAFERPVLVGPSVAEAIAPDGRDPVLLAVATHAHDFVSRLPEGYRTALDDAPLSGGEVQRLGLARAWAADRVLVLDDATSSLDTATEMRISRTLTSGDGRTRLVVTHRAATADRADAVVWLEGGRIRAVGPHRTLLRNPDYRAVFG